MRKPKPINPDNEYKPVVDSLLTNKKIAMDEPKKLYLLPNGLIGFCRHTDKDVEYINKDAFIKMATDYIANNMQCNGYTLQTKAKFIRNFKKRMEE